MKVNKQLKVQTDIIKRQHKAMLYLVKVNPKKYKMEIQNNTASIFIIKEITIGDDIYGYKKVKQAYMIDFYTKWRVNRFGYPRLEKA